MADACVVRMSQIVRRFGGLYRGPEGLHRLSPTWAAASALRLSKLKWSAGRPQIWARHNCQPVLLVMHGRLPEFSSRHLPRSASYETTCQTRAPVPPLPFCAPSGRCLDRTLKSGRCGDWIWFVRHGKLVRRLYVRPHDPRTPAQLRSRARLSAASEKYSHSLTEKQHNACIAAGAKLRSRPRLGQSGPLTGQQYSIRRQYALQKAHGNSSKDRPCTTSASNAEA